MLLRDLQSRLIEAFREANITKREFDRRLARSENFGYRLLDSRYTPTIGGIEEGFKALGLKFSIIVEKIDAD